MTKDELKDIAKSLIKGGATEVQVIDTVKVLGTDLFPESELVTLLGDAASEVDREQDEVATAVAAQAQTDTTQEPKLQKPDLLTFRGVRKSSRFMYQGVVYKKTGPTTAERYGKVTEFSPDTVVDRFTRPPSRAQRWAGLVQTAEDAINDMEDIASRVNDAFSELNDMRGEFEEWRDNLPENLQNSSLGEKLNAIADLNLEVDALESSISDLRNLIDEASGADVPLGFGRD